MDAMFEFVTKLGTFGASMTETSPPSATILPRPMPNLTRLLTTPSVCKGHWCSFALGTACLFTHPRYMGAGTSPSVDVFARGGSSEESHRRTHRLGGAGYVFWGGREGYDTLLNTDMPGGGTPPCGCLGGGAQAGFGIRRTVLHRAQALQPSPTSTTTTPSLAMRSC